MNTGLIDWIAWPAFAIRLRIGRNLARFSNSRHRIPISPAPPPEGNGLSVFRRQKSPVVLQLQKIQPAELRDRVPVPDAIEGGQRVSLLECPLQQRDSRNAFVERKQ